MKAREVAARILKTVSQKSYDAQVKEVDAYGILGAPLVDASEWIKDQITKELESRDKQIEMWIQQAAHYVERITALREALEFYKTPEYYKMKEMVTYDEVKGENVKIKSSPIAFDGGLRAFDALNADSGDV